MAALELPIRNDLSAYRFQTTLENKVYFFDFSFIYRQDLWNMDLLDEEQNYLIAGIPMLTGIPLLRQYTKEGLPPGDMFLINVVEKNKNANRQTFSTDVKLIYVESGD